MFDVSVVYCVVCLCVWCIYYEEYDYGDDCCRLFYDV